MSLGIGMGLSVGAGNGLPPATAWPTVADIPPGMLVLDSDGVVKQKVGDYLIPAPVTIIGSGPLASAPVASAANQNMFYMSTDFGLCKYVSVFNNAGNDWIDCGRPSWLAQLRPGVDEFTVCAVFMPSSLPAASRVYSLEGAGGAQTQFSLIPTTTGGLYSRLGGTAAAPIHTGLSVNTWYNHKLNAKKPVANSTSVLNGESVPVLTPGNYVSNSGLFIGAVSVNLTGENFEGMIAKFSVYNGSGVVIDSLDLNKWDGSGTVRFDSGHACTVTDGTPFTAKSYALIPWKMLN